LSRREFRIAGEYHYNRSSPMRWLWSHMGRYWYLPGLMLLAAGLSNGLMSYAQILIGRAFSWVEGPAPVVSDLLRITLTLLITRLAMGLFGIASIYGREQLAQLLERDARDELYISLLGKSLTFHGRQRVGDVMARATNDVRQLNYMVAPGLGLIIDSLLGLLVPLVVIGTLRLELLLVPVLFMIALAISVRAYTRRLSPVFSAQRQQVGIMNAGLEEAISGIEVVKVNAQEQQEIGKFVGDASKFKDLVIKMGRIQAAYLPLLLHSAGIAAGLLHAFVIYMRGDGMGIGEIIAFLGLFSSMRGATFLSMFTFSLVQQGVSSAERILELINTETEMDENPQGHEATLQGEVVFEHVTFGYGEGAPVLRDISFRAAPGETIAIVGETGSGKTTLTRLINRVYDVSAGRVLVDGIDVRQWRMESLRSQISAIEQDVFLFSRSIGENIAFGVGQRATTADIERCAREAQAHDFITGFSENYATEIGERGVTLSGGQRQRLAIARAFLADPRILILDDSTSAIDSATEDAIQKAMHRVQQGRTTFLITHRLSQIRWADRIVVLRHGELVDQGTHEELMGRCSAYQRIFGAHDGKEV
jgi:ATP-binding cassette subfamily B protein